MSYIDAKQIVSRYGFDICSYASVILTDVYGIDFSEYLIKIEKEKPCLNLDQLEIDGNDIIKNKWLGASVTPPCVGDKVTVVYREDNPTKFSLELTDLIH